jgi:predicted PurR-regulated permease PerM
LVGSIIALLLAAILFFVGFLLPSLAMAQLQQQQQTTTTTSPTSPSPPPTSSSSSSPPSSSITTTPPLTPEEQEQQNRLQSVIAATTANLNETEKQVSGVVFTPRWSQPVWINANSLSVLIAYCLPGEFADSGQEILGGFELEVLETYAVALPQGFMAWMAVVGNEDQQNRRFPAALGVICASDLNQADTRVLSPQEQQAINNINQQFTTIQNTQITNIDQVINIINNVTTTPPTQNRTGGGVVVTLFIMLITWSMFVI